MPCVSPDGKPTKSGIAMLSAIKSGAHTPESISKITQQPMFRIRSGLRELIKFGFVEQIQNKYQLTSEGNKIKL